MISSKHLQNIFSFSKPQCNSSGSCDDTNIWKCHPLRNIIWGIVPGFLLGIGTIGTFPPVINLNPAPLPISISCSFLTLHLIFSLQDGATFLSLPQQDNPELLSFPAHTGNTVSSSASGGESLHSDPLITPPSDSVAGVHFSPAKSKSSSGKPQEFLSQQNKLDCLPAVD